MTGNVLRLNTGTNFKLLEIFELNNLNYLFDHLDDLKEFKNNYDVEIYSVRSAKQMYEQIIELKNYFDIYLQNL